MNQLSFEKQCRVVSALVDGCSIRASERMCQVHRDTIMRLGISVGEGCHRLHDALFQDLQVNLLEVDEIWAFIGKKQKRVRPDEEDSDLGDQYTFIGIDATKKAIVSFLVGRRDGPATDAFALDLRRRIVNRPQISSDGFKPYIPAIYAAFGLNVDYAQIIKTYGASEDDERRYSPPKCIGAERIEIIGQPVRAAISTSYVERQNLTVRMSTRRFTRLTNAFSKKLTNHKAAVGLYVGHYNFCRIHETVKATPAMALGVADHPWSVPELIEAALSMPPAPDELPPAPAAPRPLPEPPPAPPQGRVHLTLMQGGKEERVPWAG